MSVIARATRDTTFSADGPRNDFAASIAQAVVQAEAGESTELTVTQAVRTFAEAIASAFVAASVSIESTSPTATACASVQVSAEASAEATARALIEV